MLIHRSPGWGYLLWLAGVTRLMKAKSRASRKKGEAEAEAAVQVTSRG